VHNIPEWFYQSLPPEGNNELFTTAAGLELKVDNAGCLKPFAGETTVFILPDEIKERLSASRDRLYDEVPEMLCREKLKAEHFHMTLHSFWDEASTESPEEVPYSHEEVFRVLDGIRAAFPHEIMMKTVCTLSMANTSVVMGLAAADEVNGRTLAEIQRKVSCFYPRPYGLTPHVTLAYFKPGSYPEQLWKKLKNTFVPEEIYFPISARELFFQSFENMNSYKIIY